MYGLYCGRIVWVSVMIDLAAMYWIQIKPLTLVHGDINKDSTTSRFWESTGRGRRSSGTLLGGLCHCFHRLADELESILAQRTCRCHIITRSGTPMGVIEPSILSATSSAISTWPVNESFTSQCLTLLNNFNGDIPICPQGECTFNLVWELGIVLSN